jgi:hypothetical protein
MPELAALGPLYLSQSLLLSPPRTQGQYSNPRLWPLFARFGLGLAISDKKIIPRKTEYTEQLVYSGGILAVPRNRKGEKCSESSTMEQK